MKKTLKRSLIIGTIAVTLVIALAIVGFAVFSYTDPVTSVQDIKFASFDADRKGFVLDLTLFIDSPNNFKLKIIKVTGDVYIDNGLIGSLSNDTGEVIPAHGSGTIVISVHIKDEQMRLYSGKDLKVIGSTLGRYLVFQKDSPFEKTIPLSGGGNQTYKLPPIAVVTGPHKAVVMQNIQLSGKDSYDKDGTIESYSWSFGDGNTGTGVDVTHRYERIGVYTVTLEIVDNDGLHSIALHEIAVTLIP